MGNIKERKKMNIKKLIKQLCNADNRHKHADKIYVHQIDNWYKKQKK